jgi:hypothetical protein
VFLKIITCSVFIIQIFLVNAQDFGNIIYSENNEDSAHRLSVTTEEILDFAPNIKPYAYRFVFKEMPLEQAKTNLEQLSPQDTTKKLWDKIKSGEIFYTQNHFYTYKHRGFTLTIDPVLNLRYGVENGGNTVYQNTRGIQIAGNYKALSFWLNHTENLMRFYTYQNQYATGYFGQNPYVFVPNHGYFKEFGNNGVDFSQSLGYLNFHIAPFFEVELGNNRHFWGNGYRSLWLSDQAAPFPYLKASAQIKHFRYHWMAAQLTHQYIRGVDRLLPRKFAIFHQAQVQVSKKLTFSIFESTIFSRNDGFDFAYLNPISVLRNVEHSRGSDDNSLLGLGIDYKPSKNAQIYFQSIIDDLNIKSIREGTNFWGNKIGFQLGAQAYDLFLPRTFFRVEMNYIRPYTYSHNGDTEHIISNYTHYNQTLAHPLGANLLEFILDISYHPLPKWKTQLTLNYVRMGKDSGNQTTIFGGDIFRNSNENAIFRSYDVQQFQGVPVNLTQIQWNNTYQIFKNIFLDLDVFYRAMNSEALPQYIQTNYGLQAGVRMQINKIKGLY